MEDRIYTLLRNIKQENQNIVDDCTNKIITSDEANNFLTSYDVVLSWIEEIYDIDTSKYEINYVL